MWGCITLLFVIWRFELFALYDWRQWRPVQKSAFDRFINKHINKHLFSVCLFFSDDRGEAMSGPPPGRQEAGAPCTGESLLLPPSRCFVSFFPLSLSLQTLISLERERSDVWCPEGLSYCWLREIWSAVGDFALSWCSPDLSTHTKTHTSATDPALIYSPCRSCASRYRVQS